MDMSESHVIQQIFIGTLPYIQVNAYWVLYYGMCSTVLFSQQNFVQSFVYSTLQYCNIYTYIRFCNANSTYLYESKSQWNPFV